MIFPLKLPANKDKVPIFPLQTFLLTQSDSDCLIFLLLRIFVDSLFKGFTRWSFFRANSHDQRPTRGWIRYEKPDNDYGRWSSGYIQRATISPLFSIKTKNCVCCFALKTVQKLVQTSSNNLNKPKSDYQKTKPVYRIFN